MNRIFILIVFIFIFSVSKSGNFTITDFGAVRDQKSTEAIQKAIDKCFESGGGNVIVPSGRFITGTLELKSNVVIYLLL